MSKYRQEKTLDDQDRTNENLTTANNVALTLYDIYSRDALENYLGFWRASPCNHDHEDEDDWVSQEEKSLSNSDYDTETDKKEKQKSGKASKKSANKDKDKVEKLDSVSKAPSNAKKEESDDASGDSWESGSEDDEEEEEDGHSCEKSSKKDITKVKILKNLKIKG